MEDEPPGQLAVIERKPPKLEKTCSKNYLTIEETHWPSKKLRNCPLMYGLCDGVDANCFGDTSKLPGCHIFRNKVITSPPKGIDYNKKDVTEQLQKIRQKYDNLKNNLIDKKIDIETAQRDYKDILKKINKFEGNY